MLDPEICDRCWRVYVGPDLAEQSTPCRDLDIWHCPAYVGKDIIVGEKEDPPAQCPKAFEHAVSLGRRGEK